MRETPPVIRRGRSALVAALCLISLVTLAFLASSARASSTFTVKEKACEVPAFVPTTIVVGAGDTVTWVDEEGYHTTTSLPDQAEAWDSGPMVVGQSFSHTFTLPGTYRYASMVDSGLSGTVIVTEAAPEFPASSLYFTLAVAFVLGGLIERRLRE
ncbi:MAG TPA: hypothetical protein VMS77_07800 [Conexivisphaerales archaeon]|nr:hypothetical protein [Conexivisphaerales archaeon]